MFHCWSFPQNKGCSQNSKQVAWPPIFLAMRVPGMQLSPQPVQCRSYHCSTSFHAVIWVIIGQKYMKTISRSNLFGFKVPENFKSDHSKHFTLHTIHSFIHTLGAIWGSVFCPRNLHMQTGGARDQATDLPMSGQPVLHHVPQLTQWNP